MDSSQEYTDLKVSNQAQNNSTQDEVEHLLIENNMNQANKELQHNVQHQNNIKIDQSNQHQLKTEQHSEIINISKDKAEITKQLDYVPQNQNDSDSIKQNQNHQERVEHDNHNSQFVESIYENDSQPLQKLEQEQKADNAYSQFEILDKSNAQQLNQQEQIQIQLFDNKLYSALNESKEDQNQIEPQLIQPTLNFDAQINPQREVIEEEEKQVEEGVIIEETNKSFPASNSFNSQVQSSPQVIEIDQKSQLILQFQKSLDEAIFLKNQGNQCFQLKIYGRAIEQYNLSLGLCDPYYLMQCPEEQLQQFKKLRINLLSNLSACYLNLGDFNSCITHANIAIQLDPSNQKVWYRRAIAFQQKQDYEEAWRDIDQAWNLVKNTTQNQEIFEKRKEIRELLRQSNKERAQLYQTMLSNTNTQNQTDNKSTVNQSRTTDSKLATSEMQSRFNTNQNNQVSFRFADIIWKTTASAVLASSITKYILEEQLDTKAGLIETIVLSSTTASCLFAEKQWQKLCFATVTAGFLTFVLYRKSTK
ncbi:unnamed protein product (macronuclear) [Paramecium tetraurelia]|uniref:Uncharacterized protein n=1 Tax=Paramecium tetraurelia TaxID=5888 RepID=A0CPD2_PARTE|nr:uncharacterized protein GSPATT00009040001 [Paramecium tetraurelia]CAK72649.1 unnamed protein product [Paramecium tetraurelia]|eukprot:XP_001440046.1 hypothetical protein (macronuclear) [Paramecium tetraurelia strain d4-2]